MKGRPHRWNPHLPAANNAGKATFLLFIGLSSVHPVWLQHSSHCQLTKPKSLPPFLFISLSSLCMATTLISLSANKAKKATSLSSLSVSLHSVWLQSSSLCLLTKPKSLPLFLFISLSSLWQMLASRRGGKYPFTLAAKLSDILY